ncbi:MAG: glycoside hydrolase family 2 TIM barrel-domain containing protein [Nostoc sp. ChiSLP02]|nr:glycoside hydrolase family 2 TIM barrel-domain containing protein [Nostoc sp. DedSLP05]MDZ8101194.1 glycoside hydrolase family 2 TIM barrel-domain containing protein [Nostoc sp. DedSLP01]MDZ8188292.1 glycoside hydrolase family 2 TIM barrel-domain containing protein [Nostoc sp. ChiSLP02]
MKLLNNDTGVTLSVKSDDENVIHSTQITHPRPQLQRSPWQSLNGLWKFAYDDEGKCIEPSDLKQWTHLIEVPFAPESTKSRIGDTNLHSNCWYEREFPTPEGDGRLLLHFGAVDYRARVWVNDKYIGEHEGGHTNFSLDITHALNDSGITKVTVWAQDDPQDLAKPRGKQDWQLKPHSIWYPRTTGIWQTVWIERVGKAYLGHLCWNSDFERWEVSFEAILAGDVPVDGVQLKMKLSIGSNVLVNDTYQVLNGEINRRIALGDPGIDDFRNELLWSPEKPTLIDAQIQLWYKDCLLDEVKSYTAMRTVSVQRDRFMLNGRPYYLRLVLDQGYWPDTLMTPPNDEAVRRDVELIKAMGFNGVRKHQKIEDPRFLYWADVLGLLVWEEMPSAYRFTRKAVERTTREWGEVIKRDSSHPCIVAWVPFNESWGVPNLVETAAHRNYVLAMYHLTKTLDPTRPVIGNDGWESTDTDILAIHDYDTKPQQLIRRYGPEVKLSDMLSHKRPGGRILTLDNYPHQGQPVMLTEFGGIAYAPEDKPNTDQAWGYERCWSISELEMKYIALLETINNIELFSGFCYTQFTDTFQEANGLLYSDRTPKFPIEVIRAATLSDGGFCTPSRC